MFGGKQVVVCGYGEVNLRHTPECFFLSCAKLQWHRVYCFIPVSPVSSLRWGKAAAPPSKPWAPSSTSQRSTPSVPCRPGELKFYSKFGLRVAFIFLFFSWNERQHGRLQAGETQRGHQTGGHRHHLHRLVFPHPLLKVLQRPVNYLFIQISHLLIKHKILWHGFNSKTSIMIYWKTK